MNWLNLWGQRIVMAGVIGGSLYQAIGSTGERSVTWMFMVIILAFLQFMIELQRWARKQMIWALAANSGDPVQFLVIMDYVNRLSPRRFREMARWMETHTREDLDNAPPVVRDLFIRASNPPKEH